MNMLIPEPHPEGGAVESSGDEEIIIQSEPEPSMNMKKSKNMSSCQQPPPEFASCSQEVALKNMYASAAVQF